MNYKICLLTLIFAISCVFSQTSGVTYPREDLAVLRVSGADMAHVELTNSYTKSGSEMYLTDCGLTTCYLTLVITPDAPLDSRTILGRVAGGSASYAGMQVYETRTISVPRNIYKTILNNYTTINNLTSERKTVFYGEEVFDKTIYEDKLITDWYPMDYASMDVGRTYTVRLEYHKNAQDRADLIPEINGVRVEGWAWWNTSWIFSAPCSINTTVASTLTNFTARCELNTSALITAGKMNSSCKDLRMVDSTNSTELLYEIENGTCNTVKTIIWVQVPTATANITNTVNIFYGNNATETTQNPNALWRGAGYVGVYHFGQDLTDSAGYNNLKATDSSPSCNYTQEQYGYGIKLASVCHLGNATTTTKLPSNALGNPSTETAWFNYTSGTTYDVLYFYGGSTDGYGRALQLRHATNLYAGDGGGSYASTFTVSSGVMTLYGSNFSSTAKGVYKDGVVQSGASALYSTSPTYISIPALPATAYWATYSVYGTLDEFRIRNATSTNDWVIAERNQSFTIGAESVVVSNNAPTIRSAVLSPSVLYFNTTAYCAVNYTDDLNTTFSLYTGLAFNGTKDNTFNRTLSNYNNGTINNDSFNLQSYSHGTNVSCWSFAVDTDASPLTSTTNYTANITISNYYPVISNVLITNPLVNGSNATGTATFTDAENDTVACTWKWYKNGTSIWNATQSPCLNSSTISYLNYSISDLINFTVNASDAYGGFTNLSYSATVEVQPTYTVNNYTYNSSQYGSVPYDYTINVSLPAGNNLTSASVYYNSFLLPGSCTNISTTYYCTLSGVPAPLTATNGTAINATWIVDYTDGITPVESNTTMPITLLYSVWATGINSSTIVAGGGPATVNVLYGNTAGITATLSGTAWLLGTTNSGTLTCAAGVCSGTITTPSVSSATLYQVEANITLTSFYWGSTQNRVVRIENTLYSTAANSLNTSSGTVTNPSNGWDLSWTTYATMGSGGMEYFNYTFTQLYYGNWTMKDFGATRNYAVPNDCIRPVTSFRVQRTAAGTFNYSCYNYSSETYSTIYTTAYTASAFFYEQNITRTQNNSLVKVVPFGLTTCTVGTPLLNYLCFDETTGGSLTCNYAQTFILNTTSGNLIQTFNGTDDNWTICFYPSTLEGNLSSTEEITATGYDNRFFYILGTAFNSSVTFNETRWAGPSATTKLTFVYVKRAGVGEPGVYVYVQRLFVANNTFKTVGMGKTNDDGTSVVYLEPNDAFYKFVVVDSAGTVLYTSSTQQVGCASTAASCSVTLNIETSVVDFWDYHDGISSACTFDNTTKIVSCSFVVASGVSKYFQLDVYRWAQFGNKTLNCTKNTTTSSGTLWCDMGDASTTGTFVYYLQSYTTGLILSEGTINWMAVASWGTTGLFIALVFIVIMGGIGTHFGPSMTILLAYVGFVLSWLFQLVNVDLLGIVGLGVGVGALMYVIKH